MSTEQVIINGWRDYVASGPGYGELVNFAVGVLAKVATLEGLTLAGRREIVAAIERDLDA